MGSRNRLCACIIVDNLVAVHHHDSYLALSDDPQGLKNREGHILRSASCYHRTHCRCSRAAHEQGELRRPHCQPHLFCNKRGIVCSHILLHTFPQGQPYIGDVGMWNNRALHFLTSENEKPDISILLFQYFRS